MPLRPGLPTVVTIHDLAFFTAPDSHSPGTATFYKAAIRTSAWRATRLIGPSKATRGEGGRVRGADATKVGCAYQRVGHSSLCHGTCCDASHVAYRPLVP